MKIVLVAAAITLLILALAFSVHAHLFASIGWHDLATAGLIQSAFVAINQPFQTFTNFFNLLGNIITIKLF